MAEAERRLASLSEELRAAGERAEAAQRKCEELMQQVCNNDDG